MRTRPTGLMLLTLAMAAPGLVRAQKLDKDDKSFLDQVRPLILRDEEGTYRKLKDKGDRMEFQKIFWARRDPDLATPQNEFQEQYLKARATAERDYAVPGEAGWATDCGRVFILLGKPDEVRQDDVAAGGLRAPETWTYRDKPGRTFQGGKATIAFEASCRAAVAIDSQLERIAATKVLHPNIDYRFGKDGRLVKLAELLPKDTRARALFKQPRQEFRVGTEAFYLKVADGGTALIGLLRGDASGLPVAEGAGRKTVNVSLAASVLGEDGSEAGWTEQTMDAPVGADGSFLGSFKMGLKPGKYTLKAGAVELKSGKGALASVPIEVPDFQQVQPSADGAVKPSLSGTVIVVSRIEDLSPGAADPADPFAAFQLTTARLIPVFPSTLRRSDTVSFFYQVYDLQVNPQTGKADGSARVRIVREGKGQVVSSAIVPFDTPIFGSEIGPVPLENLEPGKYVARLEASDKLAQKTITRDCAFEVLP